MTNSVDCLIVGAGPVGLTLAAELTRHGASVRIVERRSGPVEHSNALILHVRTLELFEAMGIAHRFVKASFPVEYLSLHSQNSRLAGIRLYGIDGPFPGPRILGQNHIEQLLVEHLGSLGVAVDWASEASAFARSDTGIRATIQRSGGDETIEAKWLIGCDGAHSSVRDWAAIPSQGERYEGLEFVHADCRIKWSYPSGRAYAFLKDDFVVALFPFDAQGRYRLLCARAADGAASLGAPPSEAEMLGLLRGAADPEAEIESVDWLARWYSGHLLADSFDAPNIFLAGDAAHNHVPLGGQGMNIGIQDAVNLGWKLAAVATGLAHPSLLESYSLERRPIAQDIVRLTDRLFKGIIHPSPSSAVAAIRMVGSVVMAIESVQDRIRRLMGEVNYAYRSSPIATDLGGSTGPIAGERVLDTIGVRASDRRTIRLFELLEGAPWTLMVFAGTVKDALSPEKIANISDLCDRLSGHIRPLLITIGDVPGEWPGEALLDREEFVHELYGVRGPVLYLIRPDWYVGFRAPTARLDALTTYLETWLNPDD